MVHLVLKEFFLELKFARISIQQFVLFCRLTMNTVFIVVGNSVEVPALFFKLFLKLRFGKMFETCCVAF